MVVTITCRSTKAEIEAALKRLEQERLQHEGSGQAPFDARKYCGVIRLKEDPLVLQKKWRGEWD